MHIRRIKSYNPGFALPTILIASVVMLAVLATSVAAATSTRSALQAQYFNQLARDAADSGLAMAKACIAAGTTTWTNPLRPGGTCTGLASQCTTSSCYVLQSGDIRTTFSVSTPAVAGDASTVTVSGMLEQTRTSTGSVWRSYSQTVRKQDVSAIIVPTSTISWSQVDSDGNTTCAISTDSKTYCWGLNNYGQTGTSAAGTTVASPTAVVQGGMPAGATIRQISVGSNSHTCAVASDNKAYCWGLNSSGQLGDGTTVDKSVPTAVAAGVIPAGSFIRQISTGSTHTCAIASDNKAYCWGAGGSWQLGTGNNSSSNTAVAVVQGSMPAGATVRQIAAGSSRTCAIASDNKAYCWGNNGNGQLGDGTTGTKLTPTPVSQGAMPAGATIRQISGENAHTCAIASDNKAYCWGANGAGRLGNNSTTGSSLPVAVSLGAMPANQMVRQITTGTDFACVIASDNNEYCWGDNTNGELGTGNTTGSLVPVAVTQGATPAGATAVQIASGGAHSCTIESDGNMYCRGFNSNRPLGDGTSTTRLAPTATLTVTNSNAMIAQQVSTGSNHTCAIASDNKAYCWGTSLYGQIGDGGTTQRNSPVAVVQGAIPAGVNLKRITAVNDHGTCAIGSDNKAYCWGRNNYGQVGDGGTTQRNSPVAVVQGALPSGSMLLSITQGSNHTCAIASDNKAYCWGFNGTGQLGDASTTQRTSPTAMSQGAVPAGLTVNQVSGGNAHTCLVAADNKAYCSGDNSYGQLGDNTSIFRTSLVAVNQGAIPAGATINQISVGFYHTCVVASDNKAYCWGRNTSGQLGDNSTTNRLVPVAVAQGAIPAGVTILKIAAGRDETCVLASDNKAYCWGLNTNGQVGDNTVTQRLTPVAVLRGAMPVGATFKDIVFESNSHVCGIASDNATYCWGINSFGNLGDGTMFTSRIPTAVNPFVVYPPTVMGTYYF